ncbi:MULTISPECIES: 50S ribosomal protein L25 [unclassified Oceanispirochaeta]|uniref:50S ribosomal protein L25 n=1 Tax=unclassified Oceanispirochaeta TaxID=2635722 RepID=UPI000E09D093|nr:MULTISPECIES: 50S ribosomal protein L25 [unclassified Oceanispirochaeta]MBF9018101.1 50S ribosomal protein L25 [Oceanispirochaeta sp. M2]NPD74565.1 50S ribosomal protein L25 [Oceanispirochaeta sp. M1]RDG29595.1 50S ribosomal protein L25 [Oceanispirochaeta sp. M1]
MEQKSLSVIERTEFKKGPAKKLRSEGLIPAVVYGHTDPLHIAVNAIEFGKKFKVVTENTIIKLELGKKTIEVLVKAIDEDIVTDTVKHIDFYEFEKGKTLKTRVPIRLVGVAIGTKEGGNLEHKLHELEIECLPTDLPDTIEIDISGLNMGESIHVGKVAVAKGVKILNPEVQTIVVVTAPKAVVVETEEGEDAEDAVAETEGAE